MKRSILFQRFLLVLSALAAFGIAAWVGMRIFEPVVILSPPPLARRVSFDPQADVRNNPLFAFLRANVVGDLAPGALGRANPFVGPVSTSSAIQQPSARLASIEEIPLFGGRVLALAPAGDGSMLVLLRSSQGDGTWNYEIRSYLSNGDVVTFTSWSAGSDPNLQPTAMTARGATVLLGGAAGHLGTVERGAIPTWIVPNGIPNTVGMIRWLRVDATNRLWMSDGAQAFMEQDPGVFQSVDLLSLLREDERVRMSREIGGLPTRRQPVTAGASTPLHAALRARRMDPLTDGRVVLTTGYVSVFFPLSANARPEVRDLMDVSTVPILVAPNGDVWGMRVTDDVVTRSWSTGTQAYVDRVTLPYRAFEHPELITDDRNGLVALDYRQASAVLWFEHAGAWVAQIAMASGTLPLDTPAAVQLDGTSTLWVQLEGGGLLRVTPPASANAS
jgi:hypothetical protein